MAQATEKQIEFIKKLIAKRANWYKNLPKPAYRDRFNDMRFQMEADEEKKMGRFFELAVIDYASLTSKDASKLIDALNVSGNAAKWALEEVYERNLEHFFGIAAVAYVESGMQEKVDDASPIVQFLRSMNWTR